MAEALPGGLTSQAIMDGIDKILREDNWDEITVKVVLRKLEAQLLPPDSDGALKAHKKFVKAEVDNAMKRILAERQQEESAATEEALLKRQREPDEAPYAEAEATEPEEKKPRLQSDGASRGQAAERAAQEQAAAGRNADAHAAKRAAKAAKEAKAEEATVKPEPKAEPKAEKPKAEMKAEPETAESEEEEEEEEEEEDDGDEDSPKPLGRSTRSADGKKFYDKFTKGDDTFSVGQDVYLLNELKFPYIARLQEIYTYNFAPSEVYFSARWYYSLADCHDYAEIEHKNSKAKGKYEVKYDGARLEGSPKEVFFSTHLDENHADCVLRACAVYLLEEELEATRVEEMAQHEYFAYRAYYMKHVYALSQLPNKKLKDAFEKEVKRSPRLLAAEPAPPPRPPPKQPKAIVASGALSNDEMRAVWLPRRHMEVWMETGSFSKMVSGTLVRCSQRINGARCFYVAYVAGTKRAPRPYRLGQKMAEMALLLKTNAGTKLTCVDALSNEPPSDEELARFKVPLQPRDMRKKLEALQVAMRADAALFEEEEIRRKSEEEERLRWQREAASRHEQAEEAERERREAERDEIRRRAAAKAADDEQWWLRYAHKDGGSKAREIAKWKARLKRFKKIGQTSQAEGERENAERLAQAAELKIISLEEEAEEEA